MARVKRTAHKSVPAPGKTNKPLARKPPRLGGKQPRAGYGGRPKPTRPGHRYRPGTVALREIRRFQKTGELLIPKRPFLRLLKGILQATNDRLRITETAVAAIHEAAEAHLVVAFEDANLLAIHAHRVTIQPRDMKLARLIRRDEMIDFVDTTGDRPAQKLREGLKPVKM